MKKRTFIKRLTAMMISMIMVSMMCAMSLTAHAVTSTTADTISMAEQIAIMVNEARTEAGLSPLKYVPGLCDAATERATESVALFSHTRPDGSAFYTVLNHVGFYFTRVGENLAAGCDNAADTFSQWKNSPSHWKNIMNENYTHIGVGVVYDESSIYKWHWEQIFVTSDTLEGEYLPGENTTIDTQSLDEGSETEVADITKETENHCGDVDGDGVVSVFDYAILSKALRKQTELTEEQIENADCFKDGKISVSDAVVLKCYLLNSNSTITLPVYSEKF
jgi:hypothetical protein